MKFCVPKCSDGNSSEIEGESPTINPAVRLLDFQGKTDAVWRHSCSFAVQMQRRPLKFEKCVISTQLRYLHLCTYKLRRI